MRKSIIRRFFFSILFLVFLSSPVLGKEVGDLVYRDAAWAFSLFTGSPGHVGIYIGLSGDDSDPQVIEALAFEEPYAIQKNSMQSFLNANTYKGSKTTKTLPTYIQRRDIVNYAKSIVGLVFTYYDANHLNQKGKDSNGDGFEDEFDCVGLAERAYENVGLNPVIDEGAFITPKEQFESDRMGNVPTNLPSNPTRCSETYGTQSDYWQSKVNNPDFNWSGDYDEDSDIHGYYYYWGTSSSGTSTSYTTFAGYDPSSVGTGTYYLRVRAKDKANNYASSWDTIFVFRYDGNDPIPQPSSISVSNGVAVSPSTVTLGENFTVTFSLKERFGESKTFDQIAVAILRDDGSHVFDFAVWDNITISGYGTWTQSVENYLYAASSEGIYKAVIRGKETGGEWFDFGTVESGENPKSFIATKQGEGDDPDDPDPDDDVHIVSQEIRVYKDGSFVPELYFTLDPGQTIFLETEGKVKNEGSNDLKDVDIDHRVDASKDRFDENDTNMGDDKDDIDRGDIEVSHSPRITIEVANDGRSVYVKGDGSGERFSLIENRITLYFFLDVESENDKDISSPHVRQEYAKVNIIVREMIPPEEREALVALYDSTNGSGWTNNSNWKTDSDPCSWYGVSCSDGHVTSLMLDSNELSGSIPPKLGNLTNLTILWLYENQLTGAIPPELGNLTNLTQLILSANQLTGAIPPELGNLTSLTTLWLNENQLTGAIPSELGNLTNLTQLFLSANQLTGAIPPELGNLSNLTELWLYKNQLTGAIPPELGNLTNLTELYLIENQLTGAIPSELGNLSNLTKLSLVKNQLSGAIPPELGNLTNLTGLYLHTNQLTGAIPPELGSLTNLTELYLYDNQLSGLISPEIGNLINLTKLSLFKNQLTGVIPPELGNLTNLTGLWLYENQLTGVIPPELGNLTNLTELSLTKNQLSGAIPPELGILTNLTGLYLHTNQLTGVIPPELGNLTNLTELSLGANQLTGVIPPELGNLTNLTRLYLEANQLTGVIPSELGNLTNLAKLSLYENQLTGAIPFELGNLINLTNLGLHNNQLEGPVTEEIIKLTNLIDNQSNFCGNYLYTFNPKVKTFLNSKQIGDDWERCQNKNGDLNRDGNIDLRDPIDELKLLSGMLTGDKILKKYDINIDGKIGLEEATYSLQIVADERLPITNKKLVITFESNDVMPTWNESKKEWYYYLTYTVYNPNDFPVEILAWGQFNECLSNIEECTEDPLNFQKWLTSCGHGSMYVPAKGYACDTSWWMSGYACNGDETGNYAVWYKDEAGNAQVSVSENLTLRQTPSND